MPVYKYRTKFDSHAYSMALLGLTNKEIAGYFHIDESSLYRWIKNHPSFKKALKKGRDVADAKVAKRLFSKCMEGNVTAIIFYLKSRKPEIWGDQQKEKDTVIVVKDPFKDEE